jgi:hypothetical protein
MMRSVLYQELRDDDKRDVRCDGKEDDLPRIFLCCWSCGNWIQKQDRRLQKPNGSASGVLTTKFGRPACSRLSKDMLLAAGRCLQQDGISDITPPKLHAPDFGGRLGEM